MGSPALFTGTFVKFLKANLNLFDVAYILTGTQDPRSSATDAPKGSVLLRQTPGGNGEVYTKNDAGLTTNWRLIASFNSYTPEILDTFTQLLVGSPFNFLTRSLADIDGSTLVTYSGTAALDPANLAYSFAAAADAITSVQLLEPGPNGFLDQGRDVWDTQVTAIWKPGFIDTAATYEVSRDGGLHWFAVTMTRVGGTNTYNGDYRWLREEETAANFTQLSGSVATELTGTAGTVEGVAQRFTLTVPTRITSFTTRLRRFGSPSGNVFVEIQSDNATAPSGGALASSGAQLATSIATVATNYTFTCDVLLPAGTYWIVVRTDDLYKSSFVTVTTNLVSFSDGATTNRYTLDGTTWSSTASGLFSAYTGFTEDFLAIVSNLAVQSNTVAFNATTKQAFSQGYTPTASANWKRVTIGLRRVGTPGGTVKMQVVRDNAGMPSTSANDVLSESAAVTIATGVTTSFTQITFDLPDVVLPSGTLVHMVLTTDATYKSSFSAGVTQLEIEVCATNPPPGLTSYNGTTWTIEFASQSARFVIYGRNLDLRMRITASVASKLHAWGVFYDLVDGPVVTGFLKRQVFNFNSVTDNTSTFTITAFTPDPDLITCYYIQAGQAFKVPAFDMQGTKCVFPANTFNNGGISAAVTLVFDQSGGDSFDRSDLNALLMAANHLGSIDGGIDRSVPGRGIMIRRPDGTLREIALNNNDELEVYSV